MASVGRKPKRNHARTTAGVEGWCHHQIGARSTDANQVGLPVRSIGSPSAAAFRAFNRGPPGAPPIARLAKVHRTRLVGDRFDTRARGNDNPNRATDCLHVENQSRLRTLCPRFGVVVAYEELRTCLLYTSDA